MTWKVIPSFESVSGWNPVLWPFKPKFFASTFTWYYLLRNRLQLWILCSVQRKCDSPGLMDFAIAPLVNSVLLHKNCVINPAYQTEKVFGASWNEFWASTCHLQFPRMASWKTDFLCTLLWFTRTFRLTVACVLDQCIYIRLFCSLSSIAGFSDIILQSEI